MIIMIIILWENIRDSSGFPAASDLAERFVKPFSTNCTWRCQSTEGTFQDWIVYFVHWFVVGFHYRIERYKWRQHHQSTSIYWIKMMAQRVSTTCLHNVSPLFSTAATSHLQHPHLACCWEVPDVILSFKAGQRVRMNLWCSHEFGSFHIPAQLRRLSNLISWYLVSFGCNRPKPLKEMTGPIMALPNRATTMSLSRACTKKKEKYWSVLWTEDSAFHASRDMQCGWWPQKQHFWRVYMRCVMSVISLKHTNHNKWKNNWIHGWPWMTEYFNE
jgi:hypothetical protein